MEWTVEKETKLREWMMECKAYSFGHKSAAEALNKRFTWITAAISCFGVTGGILEGANLLLEERYISLPISVLVCTSFAAGLAQWLSNKNPSEQAASHQELSKGYSRLSLQIDTELAQEPNERMNGTDFLKMVSTKLTDLSTGSVHVPEPIWDTVLTEVVVQKRNSVPSIASSSSIHDSGSSEEDGLPEVGFRRSETNLAYQMSRYGH